MANLYDPRPMKKKNGTSAGIPRPSGERSSPALNGAVQVSADSLLLFSLESRSQTRECDDARCSGCFGRKARSMLWAAGIPQVCTRTPKPAPISLPRVPRSQQPGLPVLVAIQPDHPQSAEISRKSQPLAMIQPTITHHGNLLTLLALGR